MGSLSRKVRRAFNAAELIDICARDDFSEYADKVELTPHKNGAERFYYYRDNGSKILAVAHLDSVHQDGRCTVTESPAGLLALSGVLDDRLGAYVILKLLPKLGIVCDILLTTDEEIGQSTAEAFTTDKVYNHIISFDRGGRDVVMYEYDTTETRRLVRESGATVGNGSFSDICELEHLGCAGFNWGVGYYDYHGPRGHAWLSDTFMMVAHYIKFHRKNADTLLVHDPVVAPMVGMIPYRGTASWKPSSPWRSGRDGWQPQYWESAKDDRDQEAADADNAAWKSYMRSLADCPTCHEPLYKGFCTECGYSPEDEDDLIGTDGGEHLLARA